MRMEVSKPRPHRNFYFFKSRKERPSQQAVKLIYLYNPSKACSGIVGPICFSKRQEISGESVIIYGFKAADGFVNIFDTTAALFDLFYLFPINCRLFYFHKKMSPLGHINERCGGSCYSKYTSFFREKQAAFIELNRICHILRRNWTGERGKPGRCGLWTLSTLLLTCTWPPLGG